MSQKKTLLVFGIGKLGGPVVDVLARNHPHHRFVVVSRDRERSQKRANLSRYLASQWGLFPEVIGEQADLLDIGRTAELIGKIRPDVVFNATTPFPWWKLELLPEKERDLSNRAGPGMWCALDSLLPMCLTEALSMAQSQAIHVNGCYPDMTNAFLSGHDRAPRLGIGNISNVVPGLQLGYAAELGVDSSSVEIRIVGHHYVSWNAPSARGCDDAPYELSVTYPDGELRFSGPNDTPFEVLRRQASRVRGLEGLGVTIGSAATVLDELIGGNPRRHHCPGAKGLPGGYPVKLKDNGEPDLDLPSGLSAVAASEVNAKGQQFDGVQQVEAGRVMATSLACEAYEKVVGVTLPEVTPSNVIDLSLDAIARLESRFKLGLQIA
jgi:hypothetical protein